MPPNINNGHLSVDQTIPALTALLLTYYYLLLSLLSATIGTYYEDKILPVALW